MKKGMMLACVVGLASISLLGLTGGASAAKNKIGDRSVGARNLANNAIHCRSLDKYLKGHLCGPNASVKKGGVAGPQGPPGPPGPGGSGATEVYYVANALGAETNLLPSTGAGGLQITANCVLQPDPLRLVLTSANGGGTMRATAVTGDNAVDLIEIDPMDAAVEYQPFDHNEAVLNVTYVRDTGTVTDGTVVTGTFQVSSDDDGALGNSRDCVFAGHLSAS